VGALIATDRFDAALFDVRVDGNVADRLRLAGKPAPDAYLLAARELGVEPARAVVVEHAIAGVQPGRAGGRSGRNR
jgi:HAD superfamily hydrolase (TIGR01509 family)